jgi:hypothetical protein
MRSSAKQLQRLILTLAEGTVGQTENGRSFGLLLSSWPAMDMKHTTTRDIAAYAGCSEGLIHRYFKSKRARKGYRGP